MYKEFSTFTEVRQEDLPTAGLYVRDETGRNWKGTKVVSANVLNHLYNPNSMPADGENTEWNWCWSPVWWLRLLCHGSRVNFQLDWSQHMTWYLQNTIKIPKPRPVLRHLHHPALVSISPSSMQSRGDAHPCWELKKQFTTNHIWCSVSPGRTQQLASCSLALMKENQNAYRIFNKWFSI